jgi:hypothetical protein
MICHAQVWYMKGILLESHCWYEDIYVRDLNKILVIEKYDNTKWRKASSCADSLILFIILVRLTSFLTEEPSLQYAMEDYILDGNIQTFALVLSECTRSPPADDPTNLDLARHILKENHNMGYIWFPPRALDLPISAPRSWYYPSREILRCFTN